MKSIELFCASPASTAVCSSMEQYSMVRHGMRQIDRKTHRLGGGDRRTIRAPAPCSSQLPFDPRPYNQKGRKNSTRQSEFRRKSSADATDLLNPNTSSRYLLSENPMFEFLADAEHSSALVPFEPPEKEKQLIMNRKEVAVFRPSSARSRESPVFKLPETSSARTHESPVYSLPSTRLNDSQIRKSSSTGTRPSHQVVELRVSIHCKGCAGKVKKHLSRMEGVTSFSIDMVSKKVTVIGDVTPLGVLASISKVKNAQFWPSPTSSSSTSSSNASLK